VTRWAFSRARRNAPFDHWRDCSSSDLPFGQIDEADCAQRVGFAETPPDAGKIPIDHAALRQIGDVRIRSDFSVTAENNRSGFLRH